MYVKYVCMRWGWFLGLGVLPPWNGHPIIHRPQRGALSVFRFSQGTDGHLSCKIEKRTWDLVEKMSSWVFPYQMVMGISHVSIYLSIYLSMYVCMYVCIFAYLQICIYANMHMYMYMCMCVCVYVCMYGCIWMNG